MNWTAVLEWCRQKVKGDVSIMTMGDMTQVMRLYCAARKMLEVLHETKTLP